MANGQINLDFEVNKAHVGFAPATKLIPFSRIRGQGQRRRMTNIIVQVLDTVALTVNGSDKPFRNATQPMNAGPVPFTGSFKVPIMGWSRNPAPIFTTSLPVSSTILEMSANMETGDL